MRRTIELIFLLLLSSVINAQIPEIDVRFRDELYQRKKEHYQQMMLCEQHKTANQYDYDAVYYSIDLTPNPITSILNGTAEAIGEVTAATLNKVELNFWDGMTITDVHVSGSPGVQLNFTRQNDILSINLDRDYVQGERFRVSITYSGQPQNSSYYSFAFDSFQNEPMIWTLSSVFGARAWWPCKDVPSDKPDSVDIRVTVPGDLIVVSNGSLRDTTINGGQTTYWWHENYPIATYLVSLAIYPYEVHYDDYVYNSGADTMEIQFYSFPGNYNAYYQINNLVKDMLACYSDLFGEYPFADEKYAQADFLWGGGMEHQTCTSYGSWNEGLFAHEIAHQWWGDMITCDNFHHIWLNEGFASYCEALWFEYTYPPYTASEYQMMYQLYLGPGTVYVEHPEYEDIFDSGLSYVKGSWILHMLRHVVGENNFFNILKAYYASSLQYGSATTEDFQAVCEQVSGMDLDKFFYQWIHEEYYPHYSFSWTWQQNGPVYDIDLEIRQDQTNYLFWMPVDVTVTTVSGETTSIAWDSLASQSFQFTVNSEPTQLELDKDNWILKRLEENFVDPTFNQGILLVNGVLFDVYDQEIRSSYENRAFWGDSQISFWDCFNPPAGGYPSTLPAPIGFGKVPGDILGQYSTVIWVGNDYGGDLGSWQQTSILPYLESGGNVILLTRRGQSYIDEDLREYLGITWAENPLSTIQNCVSTYPGLSDMSLTGTQSSNALFETDLTDNESTLLFQETASFGVPRGLGVWRNPASGGTYRSEGGDFVFVSGRSYRYDSNQLSLNIEYILEYLINGNGIPLSGDLSYRLEQNYPNPFNNKTTIRFFLSLTTNVSVHIYNLKGQLIRTLLSNQNRGPGYHTLDWDGKDKNQKTVGSGIYYVNLETREYSESRKIIYLR